jgi:hypothetical protein
MLPQPSCLTRQILQVSLAGFAKEQANPAQNGHGTHHAEQMSA